MPGKRRLDQISINVFLKMMNVFFLFRIRSSSAAFKKRCQTCQSEFNSRADYASHFKGQKHKQAFEHLTSWRVTKEVPVEKTNLHSFDSAKTFPGNFITWSLGYKVSAIEKVLQNLSYDGVQSQVKNINS